MFRYKSAEAAKGRLVTANELDRDLPAGENGAPELMKAALSLVKGAVLPDYLPPRMRMTPSGRAVVGFEEDEWVDDKVTNRWEAVAADILTNKPVLDELRVALGKPVFDNHLDYSGGPKMLLPHLPKIKTMAQWLGPAIQLAVREGRLPEAADYLVAEIRLPQVLARDRIVISELVRDAVASIARSDTWEALQAGGWSDEDLARIQQAWEAQTFIGPTRRSCEGEGVYASVTFELFRRSNKEAVDIMQYFDSSSASDSAEPSLWKRTLDNLPGVEPIRDFVRDQIRCRVWRFAWLDQSELRYLERVEELIEIARFAEETRSMAETRPKIDRFLNVGLHPGFYDRLRFPTQFMSLEVLDRLIARAMRVETERSLILASIGIKRYALRHGRGPETFSALVPEFLPTVPIDYMDGKPIRYRLNPDGSTVLYSVGEDGTDGGGDAGAKADAGSGRNIWDRKDCVWPAPALPEEIEAYRIKAFQNK